MNRLKQAWLALWGRLEPGVREVVREVEVVGAAHEVKLYQATKLRCYTEDRLPKWNGNLYHSCDQAFAECDGAEVSPITAIQIGDKYFRAYELLARVQPKPKVAKGKRKA